MKRLKIKDKKYMKIIKITKYKKNKKLNYSTIPFKYVAVA